MTPDRRSQARRRLAHPYVANLLSPAGSVVAVALAIDISWGRHSE
jgi:hypothetical protein